MNVVFNHRSSSFSGEDDVHETDCAEKCNTVSLNCCLSTFICKPTVPCGKHGNHRAKCFHEIDLLTTLKKNVDQTIFHYIL